MPASTSSSQASRLSVHSVVHYCVYRFSEDPIMTNYTAPELLLVGTAQQLVLSTCPIDKSNFNSQAQVEAGLEKVSCLEDGMPEGHEDSIPF
jgi:hypothetical protein